MANRKKRYTLPLIPVRGLVIFPYMVLHFDVARRRSVAALEEAMNRDQMIFLAAQKDVAVEDPVRDDIYDVGCICRIRQLLRMPNGNTRVLVEGLFRAKITKYDESAPYLSASITRLDSVDDLADLAEADAAGRQIHSLLTKLSRLSGQVNIDVINNFNITDNPGRLADSIASNILVKIEDKQEILCELSVRERINKTIVILSREAEVYELEQQIALHTKKQMDQNQKEYFLREQIKAIRSELGEDADEIDEYTEALSKLSLPKDVEKKINKEIKRLSTTPQSAAENAVIKQWLDTVLDLPWNKKTQITDDLESAQKILDDEHYGMTKVKERILEYLAVSRLTDRASGPILCLVGPPGVGKTSVAKSIAHATGREYVRMSLGGVRDEAEIRGHRKTYVGAMPGRVISALRTAGSKNALVLLDEIDKMGHDFRGDPASAMLEVLDSAQNHAFRDHYLEVPFDLSEVLFVTTANTLDGIPRPLLDRMEVIELSSYTPEEKLQIAKKYLLPRQQKANGLSKNSLRISNETIMMIIENYTSESGVRNLERTLGAICRKTARLIVSEDRKSVSVTQNNLIKFLGPKKYLSDKASKTNQVGVVTGLAWTAVGGVTLTVEVNIMDGAGKIELTGSLGNVMKESALAAISYIRSKADLYGVDPDFYKNKDIHIHVPEGATPKDGPSAGITIATALLSALTERCAKSTVAMTGEITLRGRVLPIGGLKEKLMAAYRAGIKTVIIPVENKPDLVSVADSVLSKLKIVTADNMQTVFETAIGKFSPMPVSDTVPDAMMQPEIPSTDHTSVN